MKKLATASVSLISSVILSINAFAATGVEATLDGVSDWSKQSSVLEVSENTQAELTVTASKGNMTYGVYELLGAPSSETGTLYQRLPGTKGSTNGTDSKSMQLEKGKKYVVMVSCKYHMATFVPTCAGTAKLTTEK